MNKLILEGPNAQAGFPWEDLTEHNVQTLGLWLINADLFRNGHQAAEQSASVYRLGHPAMLVAARRMPEETYLTAVSRGIAAYEAIAAYVRPQPPERDVLTLGRGAANLAAVTHNSFLDIVEQAEVTMGDLPNVRQVVGEIADRFAPGRQRYVQAGAALACYFETALGFELGAEPTI